MTLAQCKDGGTDGRVPKVITNSLDVCPGVESGAEHSAFQPLYGRQGPVFLSPPVELSQTCYG